MLEVRVLGGLTALVDGAPVTLPADARARELLAWLALHPGLHPRSALAGRLRPDVGEESARKTLRNAVYRLRGGLGPASEAVVATREQVGLAGARVDLLELRRLGAAGELEAAVALATGELLAGLDEDWVLRARDEHVAELAAILAELAERAEAGGDLPSAVRWTRRRLEVEPLAEVGHRELVRLLARSDDRPAAMAAAAVLTERLRRELGVPPSAATRELVEDVRRGRIGGGAVAAVASGDAGPSLPAPLARTARPEGRRPALDRIQAAWTDALSGTMRMALAGGEPGIGKTTLAGEIARRVHDQGATVLYGRSDEQASVPYQPWVEALERHLDGLEEADAEHWLALHDGALARLLPARGPAGAADGGQRERYLAFEAARVMLEDAAVRRPVLLVLDDIHWADEDSLALLRHVAHTALRARLLVVLCARTAELTPAAELALADLRRHGPLLELGLGGLDEAEIAELLVRRTGAADAETVRGYRRRTGGNPFFLDAVLRDEAERGDRDGAPPRGVRDVVSARLARLAPDTRAILSLGALLGLEFDLAPVAAAAARPIGEALAALDGARESGLIAGAGVPGRFAFAHALVLESIVAALPASRIAQLHLALADALAGDGSPSAPAGVVAWHLHAAAPLADAERVAHWELAAAREATSALAHAEAAGHYAAALATGTPLPPGRQAVLLALGAAEDRAGRRTEARAAFGDAAALARAAGDAGGLADAALGHGGLAVVISRPDEPTRGLLEEALAAVPASERAIAARLRARLAVELYYADPARTRELAERAVADARESEDPAALAAALSAQRVGLWHPAHVRERLAVVDEMVDVAAAAGDPEVGLQARNWRVVDLLELGRFDDAAAQVDDYEAIADRVGLPHFQWYVHLWRAGLATTRGRWAEADAGMERALVLGGQAGDPNAPLLVGIQRGMVLEAQARYDEVDLDWVEAAARESSVPASWRSWLAHVHARGDREIAQPIVDELTADGCAALPLDANWHAICEVAAAAAELGDRAAAVALHSRLEPFADLYPVVARGVSTLNNVDCYLGRLAATLGRTDEAKTRLLRAVERNDQAGAGPLAAKAKLGLGLVLAQAGRLGEAREALDDAVARAERSGMPAVVASARAARDGLRTLAR